MSMLDENLMYMRVTLHFIVRIFLISKSLPNIKSVLK